MDNKEFMRVLNLACESEEDMDKVLNNILSTFEPYSLTFHRKEDII